MCVCICVRVCTIHFCTLLHLLIFLSSPLAAARGIAFENTAQINENERQGGEENGDETMPSNTVEKKLKFSTVVDLCNLLKP